MFSSYQLRLSRLPKLKNICRFGLTFLAKIKCDRMNKKDKNYGATTSPFLPGLVLSDRRNEIVRSIVGVLGLLLLLLIFVMTIKINS